MLLPGMAATRDVALPVESSKVLPTIEVSVEEVSAPTKMELPESSAEFHQSVEFTTDTSTGVI